VARLTLDTCALIDGYRRRLNLDAITSTDNVAIPAVVVAEYLQGVLLTPDADRAERQRAFLEEALLVAPTLDYDRRVAGAHSELLAHVRRIGSPRGAHDLIIAATARATDRIVLTTDSRARFDELPGVEVRLAERT
jgi:tRNA(fMet)-specific endonuclease VapC